MKETTEILKTGADFTNAGIKILEDGKFTLDKDVQHLLPPLLGLGNAIQGAEQFKSEAQASTKQTKAEAFDTFEARLTELDPEVASDVSDAAKGFYSLYRIGVRNGRQQVITELEAAGVDCAAVK